MGVFTAKPSWRVPPTHSVLLCSFVPHGHTGPFKFRSCSVWPWLALDRGGMSQAGPHFKVPLGPIFFSSADPGMEAEIAWPHFCERSEFIKRRFSAKCFFFSGNGPVLQPQVAQFCSAVRRERGPPLAF